MTNINNSMDTVKIATEAHLMSLTDGTVSYDELNAMTEGEYFFLVESLTRDNYNLYGSETIEKLSKAIEDENRLLAYYLILKANETISQAYIDTQGLEFQFRDSDDLQRYQYEELDVELHDELGYLELVN